MVFNMKKAQQGEGIVITNKGSKGGSDRRQSLQKRVGRGEPLPHEKEW